MGKKLKQLPVSSTPKKEEDLHKLMLEQLGLKVDSSEARALMQDN